jgi:hypothetical protein
VVRLDTGSFFSIDRSDDGIEASFISASSEAPLVGFELVYTTRDILGLSAEGVGDTVLPVILAQNCFMPV